MGEDENRIIFEVEKYIESKYADGRASTEAIRGLLELYKKEKERAEELLKDREKSTEEYIHNNPWLYKQLAESYVLKSDVEKNYISKDRIREKIDFLENGFETSNEDINYKLRIEDKAQKQVLKELLEEE